MWQPRVPFVLAAFGEGPQRVIQYVIDPLGLGISVFVVGLAYGEARANAPRELLEQCARELGSTINKSEIPLHNEVRRKGRI